ncbi:MAG TPA: ATP-binding protein [Smithellaceae bacterium]|mgnify:CR=1 FL=1|nr:ATP-binding protein [Smithellaceae bacterium]
MILPRIYDNLDSFLKPNKVLVIYGARQTGKTTLLKKFLSENERKYKYKLDSGDDVNTQIVLGSSDFKKITTYAEGYDLVAIDEAQRIANVGMGLKILVDQVPDLKVLVTGSSSFELAGQVGEPLTGRKITLTLFPLSQLELGKLYNDYDLNKRLDEYLIFGSYPEVLTAATVHDKKKVLEELAGSYLLKDILELEKVKSSKVLLDLLRLLAFQVGSEVSLSELGRQLGIDNKTVARYLDLFEKSFVIFNIRGFSRNRRKEITSKSKYYFLDNGIRNAVIANFNPLEIRDDIGKLWDNFLVTERLKKQSYAQIYSNNYFWRTWDQKEIDWVEERDGKLFGYEFAWKSKSRKSSKAWKENYPDALFEIIDNQNYLQFVK